jgi:hypothetical protein
MKLVNEEESFDQYHVYFWHILSGDAMQDGVNTFSKVTSPMYELYRLLAPNSHILAPREKTLRSKLKKEKMSKADIDYFIKLREQAVKKIGKDNTYTLDRNSTQGSYGLVMGYADSGEIEEKYLPHPELAAGALAPIDNDGLKRYYLDNLPDDSPILAEVASIFGIDSKDKIIEAIIDGAKIESSFKLGFYGKCFNETILLDKLTIKKEQAPIITTDPQETTLDVEETYCADGIFVNTAATESIAARRERGFTLGWIG